MNHLVDFNTFLKENKEEERNILMWETEPNGHPTGNERIIKAKSKRWATAHLAYELGVKIQHGATSFKMPDGKAWYSQYN